jgi:hypothetical protein
MISKMKNVLKTLGLTAALALAVGMASAPAASASSLATSPTSLATPLIRENGGLKVYVGFDPANPSQQATVAIYDAYGQPVAKALATYGSEVSFELPEGIYKVGITADGYRPAGEVVKVAANSTTYVKIALQSTSATSPHARRK